MAIDPGKLDKRIDLLAAEKVRTDLSFKEEFVSQGKVWAMVKHLSDRERYAAAQTQAKATVRFTIRERHIEHNWRISYAGQTYGVEGFKPVDSDPAFMEITAGSV